MTSLATTFQQAKTHRTATSRRNLTAITGLDTSHQQTRTAPSQQPTPARPASRGRWRRQQPRDNTARHQSHRSVDPPSHELATGIGSGSPCCLGTIATIETTASVELPTSPTQPSPSAPRYNHPHRGGERKAPADQNNLEAGETAAIASSLGIAHQKAKTASDDPSKRNSHPDRCDRSNQQARQSARPHRRRSTSPRRWSCQDPSAGRARINPSANQPRDDASALDVPRRLATTYQPARRWRSRSRESEPIRPIWSTSSQLQQPSSRPSNSILCRNPAVCRYRETKFSVAAELAEQRTELLFVGNPVDMQQGIRYMIEIWLNVVTWASKAVSPAVFLPVQIAERSV
jgi:hypothetical protein